jgi:general secretion pathway protein K
MKPGERGAALLTVLLLVSVMAALAASALERLRLSTRLAANAGAIEQARLYAVAAEQIATARVNDLVEAERAPDPRWNGRTSRLPLPAGVATARLRDGGNCFNLNSVVTGQAGLPNAPLTVRPAGLMQFTHLMQALGVGEIEARRIATALADWVDSDTAAMLDGAEDAAYAARTPPYRTGNTFLADPSELRAVAGVTPEIFAKLKPWVCALPTSDLSPININTVAPDQAPLVAMLFPEPVPAERVRAVLAARPAGGWDSGAAFWNEASRAGLVGGGEAQQQVQLRTRWFALDIRVELGTAQIEEQALIDARLLPARIVRRSWGEGA